MASVKDVAMKANVAVSTVSKVVNNYDGVSAETRKKVMAAIKELNYIPNTVASALGKKKYNNVGILINNNNHLQAIDEIYMHYLVGAIDKCNELGLRHNIIFLNSLEGKTKDEIVTYLNSLMINSLVIFGLSKDNKELQEIINEEIYYTVVTDYNHQNAKTSNISIDNKEAQYEVTKKLVELNPKIKKILYLAGKDNGFISEKRLEGITCYAKDNQIELIVKKADFDEDLAYSITYDLAKEVDAIVAASDLMAIGALRALNKLNLKLPVSGFDGISLNKYINEDLLTVKQDFYKMALEAVNELNNLLNEGESKELKCDYTIEIM